MLTPSALLWEIIRYKKEVLVALGIKIPGRVKIQAISQPHAALGVASLIWWWHRVWWSVGCCVLLAFPVLKWIFCAWLGGGWSQLWSLRFVHYYNVRSMAKWRLRDIWAKLVFWFDFRADWLRSKEMDEHLSGGMWCECQGYHGDTTISLNASTSLLTHNTLGLYQFIMDYCVLIGYASKTNANFFRVWTNFSGETKG